MNVLDLFSGIGGFSLGLERAGMRTVAFCEIEPYCRKVLAKHWPNVPCYGDIRELTAERLRADGISVDLICGGFPCQDISLSGKGAGIDGERSGLWREYARLVGELRPSYIIVENVSALLGRGIGRVLGDLSEIGYDAEWHCLRACRVGLAQARDRTWLVSYPAEVDARKRLETPRVSLELGRILRRTRFQRPDQPSILRVADGLPAPLDRLGALGNAVVPQIPEIIGRAIMSID